jgi:hypothetical protein
VRLLTVVSLAALIYVFNLYRIRTIEATEMMTWECRVVPQGSGLPDQRIVLMRYVKDPSQFIHQVDSTGGLCHAITAIANGDSTVAVTASVWGNKRQGLIGWNEISINGKPFPRNGEFGGSGSDGTDGREHPYDADFRRALHMSR